MKRKSRKIGVFISGSVALALVGGGAVVPLTEVGLQAYASPTEAAQDTSEQLISVYSVEAADFSSDGVNYKFVKDATDGTVVGVKAIGFADAASVKAKVELPAQVTNAGTTYDLIEVNFFASPTSLGCTELTEIIIPEGVTKIDGFVSSSLEKISFPSTLTTLGTYAFQKCGSLKTVDLSACTKLGTIASGAFWDCSDLTSLKLPEGLASIEGSAFDSCKALTKVVLPSTVTYIGQNAFNNCESLESINLGSCDKLAQLGNFAFQNCVDLTYLDLSGCTSLTYLGQNIFFNCTSLQRVVLPSSLTEVGSYAFSGCSSLEGIDFRNCVNLETIGSYIFQGSSKLKHVVLPRSTSVTSLSDDVLGQLPESQLENIIWYGWNHARPTLLDKPQWSSTSFISVEPACCYITEGQWYERSLAGRTLTGVEMGAGGNTLYLDNKKIGTVGPSYTGHAFVDIPLPEKPGKHEFRIERQILLEDKMITTRSFYIQYETSIEVTWPTRFSKVKTTSRGTSAGSIVNDVAPSSIVSSVSDPLLSTAESVSVKEDESFDWLESGLSTLSAEGTGASGAISTMAATSSKVSEEVVKVRVYTPDTEDGTAEEAQPVVVKLMAQGSEVDRAEAKLGSVVNLSIPASATSTTDLEVVVEGEESSTAVSQHLEEAADEPSGISSAVSVSLGSSGGESGDTTSSSTSLSRLLQTGDPLLLASGVLLLAALISAAVLARLRACNK